MKTYPCLVRGQIVELTAEQRDAYDWDQSSPEHKLRVLLERIEKLEREVEALKPQPRKRWFE